MSHRVIAGSAKGRRLKLVPGDSTRPIMDRAKEALFNIIGRDIYDTVFLDLFAGTGSVGIEALSRGADHAVFLDTAPVAIKTIKENLQATRLDGQAEIIRMDAFAFLKGNPPEPFDFIYVAPPQYKDMWKSTLLALEANPVWIPVGTRVIVQIDPKEQSDIKLKYLVPVDERRYGRTLLWFFEAQEPGTDKPEEEAKL